MFKVFLYMDYIQFETFNFQIVSDTAQQIEEAMSSDKDFRPIVVHGAGSFGHFQAKQYSVAQGTDAISGRSDDNRIISSYLREGFAKTRLSVTKLNQHILTTLLAKGVPCVGISLFPNVMAQKRHLARPGTWETSFNVSLQRSLALGFVPVLHGDACLEISGRQTSIVSGDTFMVYLSGIFRPRFVVFLADVDGVLTAPPGSVPEPQLIRRIFVNAQGGWTCEHPDGLQMNQSANDVTGGIKLKLKSAVDIVYQNRIPVYIVKAGSEDARLAIRGIPPRTGTSIVFKQ